ncbi:unnamed protein product [Caenorhabditis bovis]|uniref:Uncharacterized protein n=1 Tax=Caenorhabditis bovis TaxID=2654633 RepID=A0A8S1EV01_9PELO|nr:unnamed protein product [Caenorhabditis bovis]
MSILFVVLMAISIVALINTILLPQPSIEKRADGRQQFLTALKSTFEMLKNSQVLLLVAFFLYTGFVRTFWVSIFPTCIKFSTRIGNNTKMLSYSMIVTGVGQVAGSLLVTAVGKRVREFGRDLFVSSAILVHIATFVLIYAAFPNEAPMRRTHLAGALMSPDALVALLSSFALGLADAVLQTQVYAYIADLFRDDSSKLFAIFKFFSGLATTFIFFVASNFSLLHHLLILVLFALISMICLICGQRCGPSRTDKIQPVLTSFRTNCIQCGN